MNENTREKIMEENIMQNKFLNEETCKQEGPEQMIKNEKVSKKRDQTGQIIKDEDT